MSDWLKGKIGKSVDVVIIVGSDSDLQNRSKKPGRTPEKTDFEKSELCEFLDGLDLGFLVVVASAHRHPEPLKEILHELFKLDEGRPYVAVCAASMNSALPGAVSGYALEMGWTDLIVLGVALSWKHQPDALDAVLADTHMPPGVPVCCVGVGEPGWRNAAIVAAQICTIAKVPTRLGLFTSLRTAIEKQRAKKPPIPCWKTNRPIEPSKD